MDTLSLYDRDVVAWSDEQAAALRVVAETAPGNAVDWVNVIEEIETVGRSEWNGVRSQIANALDHVVRTISDPEAPSVAGWKAEIDVFLGDTRDDYRRSMAPHLDMDEIWRRALRHAKAALARYGVSVAADLPSHCPFTLDEVLAPSFDYDAAYRRLAGASRHSGERS